MTDRTTPANPQAVLDPDATPLSESIGTVFERRAREHPDRAAWVSVEGSMSYGELNRRANQVAWALRQRAPAGDQRIGLYLRPGAAQVAALLGILKAGLTAVVLDALGPAKGNRAILEDIEARGLITDRTTADAARALLPTHCELLVAEALEGTAHDRNPDWPVLPEATACIVFTSGTTGRPKGVIRTHRNLVWVARAAAEEASRIRERRTCFVTNSHTGNGLNNLLRTLMMGGTALPFDLRSQGVDRLAGWLTEQRATIFTAPASVFRQFLNGLDADRSFPEVRIVRLSSEKVLKKDFEGFRRHFTTSCLFINTISSTETGSFATLRLAHSVDQMSPRVAVHDEGPLPPAGASPTTPPGGSRPATSAVLLPDGIPIGRALPGVDLRLVDEHGKEVDEGQPGEITIQSPGVALGYWRQPELTARYFRRSTNPADGVRYHTGDLAIRQTDGSLLYVGRRDFRVKIRGLGVSLQGVETALSSHPEVLAAAVLVRDQDQGAPWLVAFVVPRSGRKPARAELRQHLRTLVPEAAVPAVFEFLDRLPLKSQGKIDRNALELRAVDRSQRVSTSVAPRTPLETTLADLWREVLGVESIGIDDDFFDLGGDSLLATRVIARIQHSFGVRLEVRGLFEASTVAAMATLIAGTANVTTTPNLPALVSLPKGPHLPLSFAQERMWFLAQLEPDSRVYHLPRLLRLRGNLDFIALERALKEIVRRHDALRTICVPIDGVPHGELLSPDRFQVRFEDLRAISDPERELEIRRRARDELHAPFDLARDLMIRARVLQVAEDEHFLVLTLHHIASDRWSAALFVREWSQLYAAFHQGRSSPLADPAIQYSDYADWQRRWLQGELLQRQLDYWKEALAGAPTLLELPVDLPRPAISSQHGATRELSLGPTLTRALQSLAHREGATPFMILLAAWQVLLSRLSGQEDVLVGAPIAGRNHKATEGLIGFFVNTLVLRSDLSGNPTFRTFLAQVRETTLGAYQHSDLPFEKLVQELRPKRSLSHAPLFQSMLALQNAPTSALELPGIQADRLALDRGTSMFDLTLSLGEHEGVLRGSLGYCTDLFHPETIDRWIEHFRGLLEGIVSDPDQRIAALPLLSAAERHQLLHEWSVGPLPPAGVSHTPPPEDRWPTNAPPPNLCDLFEAQLVRSPLAEALLFGAERLTYRELFGQADALAARLRSLGVGPDTLVGLCVERSIDMLVALLGILRAGGAYLPLDPSHPPSRLAFILADARPRVLVTQEHLRAVLPDHTAHVVCLDSTTEAAAEDVECLHAPALAPDGDSLAYVLYTSGSTGQPKGVQIPRSALVNFLLSMGRQPGMGPEDRMLALTTLGFDIAGLELFLPLVTGGSVVIADRDTATDGLTLARFITDSRVTILQATPATWRMLIDAGWQGDPKLRILCGGEALPRNLAEQLLPRCGELWNLYGPTETTIWSLIWHVQPAQPIVIGRPIANTQAWVLDAHRQPVPIGVAGELHLGGAGLARGYLNRPELTAERFFQHRFDQDAPEVRLYRTGDRVRWRPDGTLVFLGRLDHQVKLRGFRIELGEIETVLAAAPGVAASVVLLREDIPGNPRLVAYVVPRSPNDPPDLSQLRRHVQSVLPDYMVPAVCVVIDALPLSPSGKIQRSALPPPSKVAPTDSGAPELPRTPAEELLAEIWCEVLGVSAVALHNDFFELGGHSLLALRVVARIRDAFGVELPVRVLFEHPTLADLARRLGARSADDLPQPIVPHRTGLEKDGIPLSFAQERLWFLDQLDGGSTNYHLTQALRLSGELDAHALERALTEVVSRHEALRTACVMIEGQPRALMLDAGMFRLERDSLSDVAAPERESEAVRRAEAESRRPFDLSCELMLRARCFALGDKDHLLVLTLHHIATDGWSMGIFARELSALYSAFTAGKPSPLPELPVQYADYALWQRQWLQGDVLERQLAYWKQQLADVPAVLPLPTDFPRPTASHHQGGRCGVVLEPALSQAIHQLARRENATPFMVLLAAWQVLLGRHSGQVDVCVGSPIAGRTRTEIEGLIGFFANTLVLRTDLSGNPTFRGLLKRVRETTLGAYAHQDLPFEKLVAELSPQRSLGHSPLFQVMFVLQNAPSATLELGGLTTERMEVRNNTAKFDLTLSLAERDGQLRGTLEYSSDLFEAETIERMIGHFHSLLEGIVRDADQPIGLLPMLSSDERHRLLHEWSQTPAGPLSPADGLPALFEAQVARTPDAVAVVFGSESLTYRELSSQADRLARQLRRLGAGPDVPIGLCLDRSLGLAIGILGILKAGSAYVPLDPAYPSQRLEVMVQEASLRLFVTQESLRHRLPSGSGSVVSLDDSQCPAVSELPEGPLPEILREHLAYVMFTSGSTGIPKGVAMPHGALVNLVAWHLADPRLGRPARTLQFASCNFDVSFQEMLTTWCAGGALVMIPEDTRRDPRALWQLLVEQQIERLFVPFVALQQLATWATDEALAGSRIQDILSAGETLQLTPEIRRLAGGLAGCRFHNHYGPTESHVVTAHVLSGAPQDWPSAAPIGRPIANTRIHLLDAWHQPVPIGVAGELYIGGAALARGYFGRPDLTAERFVASPLDDAPGGRLYRTGDLARWTKDGTLEFLGRADRQVKVRGYRIELEEIEAVLGQHANVLQAAVVVHDLGERGPGLVAYLVTRPGSTAPSQESLRRHVRLTLPEYMVPAAFVCLDSLPTTRNGKIDRKALPTPDPEPIHAPHESTRARAPIEELLLDRWSQLLGIREIGIHDDFFDFGGHSLMAMRVIAQIRELFGVEISVRTLFEAPTIAQLAHCISTAQAGGPAMAQPPLRAIPRGEFPPLSFAQERLWFLDQLDGGSTNYHLTQALRLSGELDAHALERALTEVVSRHEALRTACVMIEGQPRALMLDAGMFRLERDSLSDVAAPERESEAVRRAEAESRRPFDLSCELMLRARCFALGDKDHLLVLTLHHIATDGWSMGIFARELSALYSAFTAGKPSPLPELPVQYADYALWQRQWLQGDVLERQLAYWKQQLADVPAVLPLPTDFPRPTASHHQGGRCGVVLEPALSQAIHQLARRENATPFMVLLAAWQVLLGRHSGQVDVCVGSPIAGRTRTEIEGLIGFFANTLVLRTDLSGNPTFRGLLKRVRETTLGAYAHQDLPFEKLVAELSPQRSLGHSPLFQVMFVLQNAPSATLELGGLTTERMEVRNNTAKFDLTLSLAERDGQLRGTLEYSSDLFEAETIERMIGHFHSLLEGIVRDADQPIGLLPMLSSDERHRLLHEWSQTPAGPLSPADGLPALFEAQVARTPDAVAVVFGSESLTYCELSSQADRLARQLRRLGAGPDVPIGLCLDRSLGLAIGILGILKAGSAYVPLDPAYPSQRLEVMVQEASLRLFVTQESLRHRLPSGSGSVVSLDDSQCPAVSELPEGPLPEILREHLAYVMFTSGSTGIPKGVAMPHGALVNLVAWHLADPRLGRPARTLQFASCNFDVSFQEMLTTWCSGGSLVMISESARRDPEALWQILDEMEVERLFLPFVALQQLAGWASESVLAKSRLQDIISAGEALRLTPEIRRMALGLTACRFHNHYGPTESHVVTAQVLPGSPQDWPATAPIGRPIANTRIYLLDPWHQPVPIGVAGELYIGGASLARGYFGRPELTAERFVSSPLGDAPDARLYRTGDLARWTGDGVLEFLGRLDDQVKIRGFRVEPGEIERALRRHPDVREAWVVVRPEPGGGKCLAAWCQTSPDAAVSAAGLRKFLRLSLPEYMVPAVFVSAERVPLTPNGKVDASAVPMDSDRTTPGTGSVSETNTEAMMADLWCRLLEVQRIGLDENFFDLGGHSLLSLRLLEQIQQVFRTQLAPREFFENPTVRSLAACVWRHVEQPGWASGHASSQRLVSLQTRGEGPPIFFFPGGYGDETELIWPAWFSRRHLGAAQPLYALQCPGVDGRGSFRRTLAGEARECLREMRQIQPRGPWFLIGSCVGGNLAYEVARQAQAAGEAVPMLMLGDCSRPGTADYLRKYASQPGWGLRQYAMNTLYLAFPFAHPVLTSAGRRRLWRQWFSRSEAGNTTGPVEFGEEWKWRVFQHAESALRRQMSRPRGRFEGRIDLAICQEQAGSQRILSWRVQATQGTEVLVLPGTHSTYLIDGAPLIAELCRQRIREYHPAR